MVCITRWWAGVNKAHYTEKCLGDELTPLSFTHPTSRVHAVLGGSLESHLRDCDTDDPAGIAVSLHDLNEARVYPDLGRMKPPMN